MKKNPLIFGEVTPGWQGIEVTGQLTGRKSDSPRFKTRIEEDGAPVTIIIQHVCSVLQNWPKFRPLKSKEPGKKLVLKKVRRKNSAEFSW